MTRHVLTRYGRRLIGLGLALGLAGGFGGGLLLSPRVAEAQARPPAPAQATAPATTVHLSKYGNDLHAALMSLQAARSVQKTGGDVTLLLDLEGVRLADSRVPFVVRWGPGDTTVRELYEEFVQAGGKVLVCAHCAEAAGLDERSLRPGARMASGEDLAKAIQASDRILDY